MKLIARIAVAGCVALVIGSTGQHASTVHADPFNNLIEFHVTMSGTDHNATPDITVQLNIDCPSGVCPAASSAPLPDLMMQHFGFNIIPCRSQNAPPCSGNAVPLGEANGP